MMLARADHKEEGDPKLFPSFLDIRERYFLPKLQAISGPKDPDDPIVPADYALQTLLETDEYGTYRSSWDHSDGGWVDFSSTQTSGWSLQRPEEIARSSLSVLKAKQSLDLEVSAKATVSGAHARSLRKVEAAEPPGWPEGSDPTPSSDTESQPSRRVRTALMIASTAGALLTTQWGWDFHEKADTRAGV
ncbi:uncharacterized protein PgNI_09328 [Pyricularia grisea]|uniref:Uncharacterized protein n=1 Tax=Pyricularia grisea TaxID=148305 RepID=A0A6P8ASM1_PYRGI|nr:uncharacterized protein PgNI_09328 [Pyricularia grisea]TLD05103.1 hypothetical protein PgNI_09328 [Pyricularia grisea]